MEELLQELINKISEQIANKLIAYLKQHIKNHEDDKLFTPEELATYLNVSKDWVYKDGKKLIPYVKLGANLRFRKKDVDQWLDKNTNRPLDYMSGNSRKKIISFNKL